MSVTSPTAVPSFRSRIGRDARSGHYAVPHRYRLHLSLSCPHCLQIAVTHSLLGLADTLPVTLLPAVPDAPGGGHQALRPLYEASSHQHPGPAVAPVLSDGWTGRIVSTHTPDILRDLARRFDGRGPDLYPCGAETAIETVGRLCEQDINASLRPGIDAEARDTAFAALLHALDVLELRLASQEYVLGDQLTVADVQLWVTLLHLDTAHRCHLDTAVAHRIAEHPHLWAYARRLAARPAFGPHLDLDGIARRHHVHCAHCRDTGAADAEAAGAPVRIVNWAAYAGPAAPEAVRQHS
ncbi:glutathione S-transferase family protein [Streptomyces sp. HC44]|uniref:Glutathione S-transferase family protein n=1 Tax=Streptomyces scabichelini TaxID=2711217 RepID=A0A6G4VIP0_9ACTN|nr:glutathione S-transferase C-terminal domain-containing protein [Streptomyces scabichelini]NGO13979.1 glutathione S-transferase family protein [Streptomyces scabichelini]